MPVPLFLYRHRQLAFTPSESNRIFPQKHTFYDAKGMLLHCKRWLFRKQKVHIANYNSKSIIRTITDVNFTLVNFNHGKICLQVNRNQKFNDKDINKKVFIKNSSLVTSSLNSLYDR